MEGFTERYLDDLRHHWGSAYRIRVNLTGTAWEAVPRGRGTTLTAPTGSELREAIRADYWRRTRIRLVPQ